MGNKVEREITVNSDEVSEVIAAAVHQAGGEIKKALLILTWATAELTFHSKTPVNSVAKAVKVYHRWYCPIGKWITHQPAPEAVQ